MDHLWSPWRFKYITNTEKSEGCVFCNLVQGNHDESSFIIHRGRLNYLVLNIFPYASGHLLIVPFAHVAMLAEMAKEASDEMMDLSKRAQAALTKEYRPDGVNLGMNLGQAAGAGVAQHLHMHILPRWFGDSNFTTVIAETRILPETLETTYQRLKPHFQDS
jgi:ATP adenylyltransferase